MTDILNFGEENNKEKFVKRIMRKRFNADEQFENLQKKIDKMGDAFIKLTSAYLRNNVFGIIRHSNLFYDAAMKLIADITMTLKENHDQMPREIRQSYIRHVNSIEKLVKHLEQAKNDWVDAFGRSTDPDFDMLIKKGEEKFSEIIDRVEKANNLDQSLGRERTKTPQL